jgi:hypothetical protein
MVTRIAAVVILTLLPSISPAQQPPVPAVFAPVQFLIGTWAGPGVSDAGPGSGTDAFTLDVQGHVIVRRSHSEYPGKDGRAATIYDSTMFIYKDPAYAQLRADYVDNENHVIHYSLVPGADAHVARFVSDPAPSLPAFRLTYTDRADDKAMSVKFEMAVPGSTNFARTVADGTLTRTAPK